MNLRKKLQQYVALNSYVEKITSALPVGYTKLEYIASTGTQYIDTGFVLSLTDKIAATIEYTAKNSTDNFVLCARGDSSTGAAWADLYGGSTTSNWYVRFGSLTSINGATGNYTNQKINLELYTEVFKINGEQKLSPVNDGTITTSSLIIFAGKNSSGGIIGISSLKMYAFTIVDNTGKLKMNLVPAKNSAGVIGMYDTISSTFLTNTGTGTFVAGPAIATFENAIHGGLKEITAYGKITQPSKDYLDSVTANGGCEQRNLPDGYTQLEYIESTGTQYIDTGVRLNAANKITGKISFVTLNNNLAYIAGGRLSGGVAIGYALYAASHSGFTIYNTRWPEQGIDVSANQILEFETVMKSGQQSFIVNGNTIVTGDRTISLDSRNIYLFGLKTEYMAAAKVYSLKIYDNDTLVRNFVPAKNASGVVGMYDTVSGQFFTNAGTGTFTAGPVAVPTPDTPMDIVSNNGVLKARHASGLPLGYTLLEYIGTAGGSYINTGITPTINAKADVKFAPTQTSVTGYWGARSDPNRFCCTTFSSGTKFGIGMTNNTWPANRTPVTLESIYDCVVANGYASVNGAEYTETPVESFGNAGTFYLGRIGAAKYYKCKLWENNVLVFDGIPAKNANDVIGMYDLVSGQFFTNAGTGTFTAGNPVSDPVEIYTDGTVETVKDSLNNTATAEMLLKVGNYQDAQSIIDGAITRNVGVKVLDGTEDWSVNSTSNAPFRITIPDMMYSTTIGLNNIFGVCSHFQAVANTASWVNYNNMVSVIENSRNVCFRYLSGISNVNTFKQYLADQYAAGTPVIVVYPLAKSITETVSGQTLIVPPVSIKQASMSNLTVDTTQTTETVPTPARPLDIYCNNGKLGFASIGSEYTQLEYLESSGAQYMLTDVVPEKTDKISLELEFTSITSSGKTILGARDIAAAGAGINYAANSSSMTLDFFGSRYLLNEAPELNKKYKYEIISKVGYIYKEGVLIGSNTFPADGELSLPLVVFGLNNGGTMAPSEHSYKIHSVVIKGKLNLIPAKRNGDNVLGMYDTVSGQFFTNAGTGDFTAGPVVPGSQGNPETIVLHSKNLFNKNGDLKTGTYRVDNGAWVDNNQFKTLDYIPGKPGVSYTLSAQSTSETGGNTFSVQAWDSTHTNWLGTVASTTAQNVQYASGISPAGTAYLSVSFAPTYRDINTLQLEEDYRPTVYEEYSSQTLSVKGLLGFGNYQTLNYIELANGAYFDTGYKPQNGCEAEFEFDTITIQANGCSYLGSRSNDVGSGINCGRDGSKKIVADYFGTSSSQRFTSTSVFEDNTSYKVIYRNNTFSLYKNGTLFVSNTFTPTTQTQTNTLLINALHYGNNQIIGNVETLRIKSLKVWDASGNLVIDIVPVKEVISGKIGFYDRAINTFSNTFLGGGTVTAGTIDGIVFGNSVISDSQEIINGIINKKVGIIMLTGEETVGAGQSTNKFYIDFTGKIPNYPRSQDWLPICTHFAGQVGSLTGSGECNPDHTCFYTASGSLIQLYMSISGDTKTNSQFKAWLAEQYAAGTPVIVLYPIATDITENVDPQFVELTAGNSYITKESEYVESNLSVKYKKLK